MRELTFKIAENTALTRDVFRMVLLGDTSYLTRPGQFVELSLPGLFLRRPISVCSFREGEMTLLYRVVGRGTLDMSLMPPGTEVSVLSGLGNGFAPCAPGARPLLIGGGVGAAPLYGLARELTRRGESVTAVLGFASGDDVFYENEFRALGVRTVVTTADGSYGTRGFVTDALPDGCGVYYTCGPTAMLRAVNAALDIPGFVSLEARMGCGFGACMGCTVETLSGPRRVCREGPVFDRREIIWSKLA